jgi:hypothetical protein
MRAIGCLARRSFAAVSSSYSVAFCAPHSLATQIAQAQILPTTQTPPVRLGCACLHRVFSEWFFFFRSRLPFSSSLASKIIEIYRAAVAIIGGKAKTAWIRFICMLPGCQADSTHPPHATKTRVFEEQTTWKKRQWGKNEKWQTKTKVGQRRDRDIHYESKSLDHERVRLQTKLDTQSRIVLFLLRARKLGKSLQSAARLVVHCIRTR